MAINEPRGKFVCPGCGDLAFRVKRRLWDRLLSLLDPKKRYHCIYCGWTGSIAASASKSR